MKRDTIVALGSGVGRAGVAVIRVSGPMAGPLLGALIDRPPPQPRTATLATLWHSVSGDELDQALVVWFPGPASFTGEDVVELHVHGGPAVIEVVIDACLQVKTVRAAEPGEFTRRAFEHGKLDLAEAEGLADLVDAETEGQRRQALRQSRGGLSAVYEAWRGKLIEAAALIEAEIDFPDEDLPGALARRAGPILRGLATEMGAHLDDFHRGERVRDGYRIAIIGPPNAGKSSLLNALARREAAIVSELPGTTRDVVEVRLVLGGFPVWIADTAGLREAADAIEAEGVRRALARAEEADLRLGVVEAGQVVPGSVSSALEPADLLIRTKSDLYRSPGRREATNPGPMFRVAPDGPEPTPMTGPGSPAPPTSGDRWVSAVTGEGIEALEQELSRRVSEALGREETPALTRARHRRLVEEARRALAQAIPALGDRPELAAEDVRLAASALGRLTGRIDVEDLLDEIFSSFCIGK
jgi:tRNA modification GTPase